MLITKAEIITTAYISTTITEAEILDSVIASIQNGYTREAMSPTLYGDLVLNPTKPEYAELLSDYVKPFIAHSVKAALFYQQIFEGGNTPSNEDQLVYNEIFGIAKTKYVALQSYCASQNFIQYTAPTYKLKAGFILKNTQANN